MAREVWYRRSFHLDKDSKGIENLFELDRTSVIRKGIAGDPRTFATEGGFEAPRNSLDVPFSGLLEARRNSEVRCEEIPIGYELSRSLTTRRMKENYHNFKSARDPPEPSFSRSRVSITDMNLDLDSKSQPRAPSVVARLMGLDDLPKQEALLASHHSSLRRAVHEDCVPSHRMHQGNCLSVSVEQEPFAEDRGGDLLFRNHPQEKQLQEFKKEFVAHQALQGRSVERLGKEENYRMHQKRESDSKLGAQMDSEEFLDALNFLNANKDFFVKILNDPHASFAKHLQQGGISLGDIDDDIKLQTGIKLSKSSPQCYAHPSIGFLGEQANKQGVQPSATAEKIRTMGNVRWSRDDEMPGRSRWRTRCGSTTRPGRRGGNQAMPTRIVVLRPNLDHQSNEKCFSPTNPLLCPDVMLKLKSDGKENGRQVIRMKTSPRTDGVLARELVIDNTRDGPYDARAIAKQIVKHVKDDMSQRASKESSCIIESVGTRPLVYRGSAWPSDGNSLADGEVSHKAVRDTSKLNSSSPNAVFAVKYGKETEHIQPNLGVKRESHLEETKRSTFKQPTQVAKSFRESGKLDDSIIQGNQGISKKENSIKEPKALKKTCRSGSFKGRDAKCETPKVLPRSLSAPAARYIENRALENESRAVYSIERATSSSRAKSSENLAFKERLQNLKDSFSLSKKRGFKRNGNTQCNTRLDGRELPAPRQPDAETVDRNEDCKSFTQFSWQAAPSAAKEAIDKSVNKVLSGDTMATSEAPQWTLSTDLADTASETSLEKSEQPSPVSVLETPFQKERPSSEDAREKEAGSDEYAGMPSHLESRLKNVPQSSNGAFVSQPSSCHRSCNSSVFESLHTSDLLEAHQDPTRIYGVDCPLGSEEYTYILQVLRLSGITVNGCVMAHSLSSERGLNQSVFGQLEAYYLNRFSKEDSVVKDCIVQSPLKTSINRRLLFDVVNEAIVSAVKKRLSQPWMICSDQRVLVCTGKQLLEQIFSHLNYYHDVQSGVEEEALEDMASMELMKEGPWIPSESDIQSVVMDLERLLCGDIIRGLVHDLRR